MATSVTQTTAISGLDGVLASIADEVRPLAAEGRVASYIPALAAVDARQLALAVCDLDGDEHVTGDADLGFSVQSVAKVFALTLAAQMVGTDLWDRVGREPSGDPFNSLVLLEHDRGVPRNPLINAGALVVCDFLLERCEDPRASLLELLSELAGEPIGVDEDVLASETEASFRNLAMANLMASFGNLRHPVEDVLEVYVHQSSVVMTARQLARAVRFLANDGVDPASGTPVLSDMWARRVTAIMLTCGTYDAAGEFAFSVGLPCKSGVGGGIVSMVPDRMGICVWSPPLDETGNSRAGRAALQRLSDRLDLSIF